MGIIDDIPIIGEKGGNPQLQQVLEQFVMPGIQSLAMKLKEIEKRLAYVENQPLQMTYIHKFPGPLEIKLVKDEEKV